MDKIIHLLPIEKIALHGYGLGYAEGKAVLVPYTMPGDWVDIEVRHEKKDVIFGSVIDYREAAKDSQIPNCDAFGGKHACGGCDWLMMPYETQLRWKTELIRQLFESSKIPAEICEAIPSPQPMFYRNKSLLPAAVREGKGVRFGMYERYSHKVVSHHRCQLQPAVMDEILEKIVECAYKVNLSAYDESTQKGILRQVGIRINKAGDEILLILVTKGSKFPFTQQFVRIMTSQFPQLSGIVQNINCFTGKVVIGKGDKLLYGSQFIHDELNGTRFRLNYRSFFQINHGTTELLYSCLKNYLQPDEVVLDAYCGIGSIGLSIAEKVKWVCGIEELPEAVADAVFNQELNGITNAEFQAGLVEEKLPELMKQKQFSTVILDPPRKGVEESSLKAIASRKIPQILYISCNPMTLLRDVKLLVSQGYRVEKITPFDMFPQTWHIETVVKLSRN